METSRTDSPSWRWRCNRYAAKDNFQEPNIAKSGQVVQTTSLRERTESVSLNASAPMDPIPQSDAEEATNQAPPETVQRFGQTYNVYNRETLYQEVWNMPVTEVAKRYKVSDVTIHKVCKSLNIPTPTPGYWAKLRAGKPVKKTPLPLGGESKRWECRPEQGFQIAVSK